jgi:Ca2+-transporting ATPase
MQTLLGHHWHHLPASDVAQLLDTDPDTGLDQFTLTDRQTHFGPNLFSGKQGRGPFVRFLLQFHQPLIYTLLVAAIVTGLFKAPVDALVILAVVVVNALVGFLQESKALGAIAALARSLPSQATVLRSGHRAVIAASELVPGDIVYLQSGDKVPADLRLLKARDLRIDESALTGESLPVDKIEETLPQATSLADRRNMAYSSTLVTYGVGTGIVIATGDRSEIGQISEMIAATEVLDTPLMRKIKHFSHVLCLIIIALAAMTFVVDLMRGKDWLYTFKVAVALAVGAIPEGLPAAVTIMLAIGVSRMAKRHAIIRRLPAVETLGGVTVICSDKTGTLTQNQMTVQAIYAAGTHFVVTGSGYAPEGQVAGLDRSNGTGSGALHECLRAGLLCNDATIVHEDGVWRVHGDPTEGALIVAAGKAGLDRSREQELRPRLDAIPFESQHQYMATLHAGGAGQERVVYWKGSLEMLLAKCQEALSAEGAVIPCDESAVRHEAEAMGARGLRVLALARKSMPTDTIAIQHEDVADGLIFLGLQGMLDPPRPEAAQAVQTCQKAGIRVKMITGDHAKTAAAIARQLNFADVVGPDGRENVMTGQQLAELSDAELIEVAQRCHVFARVSPEHKLRLVQALQARSEIVAMTGDGVNDAPALRRADIGVAMALSGTEVAREAADMILTDDNFASIEAAVEEGRSVYETLQKFIVWTLPTNGGQSLALLLAVLAGAELPLQPVQLLWINMTTAIFLGLMLAFEPAEGGLMNRPPRASSGSLLPSGHLFRVAFVSLLLSAGAFVLFRWELALGATDEVAWTVVTAMFVVAQAFYLLNCRSLTRSMWSVGWFSNPWIWAGIAAMLTLQWAFTYVPLLNATFHSAPIGLDSWLRILGVGLIVYTAVGTEKWLLERWRRGGGVQSSGAK